MNVVHLYDGHEKVHNGRGSVPDVVWNFAKETVDRDHDVTVIERQWAGLDRTAEHEGVQFRRIPLSTGSDEPWEDLPYEMVTSLSGAARLTVDRANFALSSLRPLAGVDPDVIHVHLPFAANVLATVAPHLRRKLIYTAHLGETEKRVVEPRFSPDVYLAKRSARTVALNPSMRDAFANSGVPPERLEIVPNGVDTTQFDDVTPDEQATVREEFDVEADVLALFVGTVTPRKGVLELVEAATELFPTDDADARVVIVGNTDIASEYVEEVETVIAEGGIADRVTLTGFVSERELAALYDIADFLVLPSFEEGSSIAVSEALAAGLPVVGSRIDGIRQQIEHGTHGLLADPGDVGALAEQLDRLLRNDDERETMERAVRDRAEELSWKSVTDQLLDVYAEVAE